MVPSQFLSVVLEEDNGSGSEEDTHAYSQRSKWWECDLSQVQSVQARVKMVHDNYYFTLLRQQATRMVNNMKWSVMKGGV